MNDTIKATSLLEFQMVQAQKFLEAVHTLDTHFLDLAILKLFLKNSKELIIISLVYGCEVALLLGDLLF
ncbi:hypothetical protein I8752_05615 [Nostocaceae cyanobacterium CENA369]|uniref:Uncharacterized protein n=1 Tax=Dendronalium phyllosphericum CENA369 TaxID=1725256 RepID=A0A8J7I201_9NOST|nr:hypothetical protein [Dendronalium phyllosphericum]MBH8572523.1 hypothetical protein [Dendronalium phyllosphericum CENA369]